MWLDSPRRTVLRPMREVLEQLWAIGARLHAGSHQRRAASPRRHRSWQGREHRRPMELAEIATGLSAETIRWVAAATPSEGLELDAPQGEFELTEALVAARLMVGSLEPETVRAAIWAIAELPKVNTEELDLLSDKAGRALFRLGRATLRGRLHPRTLAPKVDRDRELEARGSRRTAEATWCPGQRN